MEIDKGQFNKLKQLDRIEFRQRYDRICTYFKADAFFTSIFLSMFILLSVLIIDIWQGLHTGKMFTAHIYGMLLFLLSFYIILMTIIDIISIIFKRKKLIELEDEYFKIEVKK